MYFLQNSGQTTTRLLYYKEATNNFENLQENVCAEVTFLYERVSETT